MFRLTLDVFTGCITMKQAWLVIDGRLFNKPSLNDDFNWTIYLLYYQQEMISIGKIYTLHPQASDFEYFNGKIIKLNSKVKPLHPNHELLYEVISNLSPCSILEVGCGGGDHLRNMLFFNPKLNVHGVDRSDGQLATLRKRHPSLDAVVSVFDLINPDIALTSVDVVYSQAVLMHISETNNRFQIAINNMLKAAKSQVVLKENWEQHNFLHAMQDAVKQNPAWQEFHLYFVKSQQEPEVRSLVLSKYMLPFESLQSYDELLIGSPLRIH
jgi:SAM-dependent methyltransferase